MLQRVCKNSAKLWSPVSCTAALPSEILLQLGVCKQVQQSTTECYCQSAKVSCSCLSCHRHDLCQCHDHCRHHCRCCPHGHCPHHDHHQLFLEQSISEEEHTMLIFQRGCSFLSKDIMETTMSMCHRHTRTR